MATIKDLQGAYPEVPPELLRPPRRNKQAEAIEAVRKVRDGYASQARFADVEQASYFREFVRRIDAALALARGEG